MVFRSWFTEARVDLGKNAIDREVVEKVSLLFA